MSPLVQLQKIALAIDYNVRGTYLSYIYLTVVARH